MTNTEPTQARSPSHNGPSSGPTGIAGWLVLPAIGLIVAPLYVTLALAGLVQLFDLMDAANITTPGHAFYRPLAKPFVYIRIAISIALLVYGIFTAVQFFSRSAATPNLMIALLLATAASSVVQTVGTALTFGVPHTQLVSSAIDLVPVAIVAAIGVAYFRMSLRVANTFRRPKA